MENNFTYIALQSGGFYGDASVRRGYCKSGQSMVIEYRQFINFMNGNHIRQPIFVTDEYRLAIDMAKQLNESAFAAQNGLLQDEQK